jgi:hypothetical protein
MLRSQMLMPIKLVCPGHILEMSLLEQNFGRCRSDLVK